MQKTIENNQVAIVGKVVEDFVFSHEIFGERFYMLKVEAERLSESCDIIPAMISERLIDVKRDYKGSYIRVSGQFRSYNRHEENKNRLILYVFVREINFVVEPERSHQINQIHLDGYICKEPTYRKTPLGREIAEVLLAVNRPYGKSDYIPCICWGRNARFAADMDVGEHIKVSGRIQSRNYTKKLNDTEIETRTAYEVSVSQIEVIHDGKEN